MNRLLTYDFFPDLKKLMFGYHSFIYQYLTVSFPGGINGEDQLFRCCYTKLVL